VIDIDSQPWFVLPDACRPLNLQRGGERTFLRTDELQTVSELNGVKLKGHGLPWFVARDLCLALNIHLGPRSGVPNVTEATNKLNDDERSFYRIEFTDGLGRNHGSRVLVVSESGMYRLVMRSDKPEARKFQDWVTREALPAIRKDGGYIQGEEKVKSGEMRSNLSRTLMVQVIPPICLWVF